jgi:hypothetical protein
MGMVMIEAVYLVDASWRLSIMNILHRAAWGWRKW